MLLPYQIRSDATVSPKYTEAIESALTTLRGLYNTKRPLQTTLRGLTIYKYNNEQKIQLT